MQKEKKSLFVKMLAASDSKIRGKRAELTATQTENYSSKRVRDIEDKIIEKQQELACLEDIERGSTTSLAVTKDGFDYKKFVDKAHEIGLDLIELEVILKNAKSFHSKYFD